MHNLLIKPVNYITNIVGKKFNIIVGALGSTWDHDFCMGMQNRMSIEK